MTIARFKDLCVDVTCPSPMTAFWGRVLGLTSPADNPNVLVGDTPGKTIWINQVDEPRTVKQRVHLDAFGDGRRTLRYVEGQSLLIGWLRCSGSSEATDARSAVGSRPSGSGPTLTGVRCGYGIEAPLQ